MRRCACLACWSFVLLVVAGPSRLHAQTGSGESAPGPAAGAPVPVEMPDPPEPAAPPESAAAPIDPVPDVVQVRVRGPDHLRLFVWTDRLRVMRSVRTVETVEVELPGGGARQGQTASETMTAVDVDQFALVCPVPCDTEMLRGAYRFGVGDGEGEPFPIAAPLMLLDPAVELQVGLERRNVLRGLGDAVLTIGVIGSVVLLIAAVQIAPEGPDVGWVIAGASAGAIALGVGIPLVTLDDDARVELVSVAPRG